MTTTISQRELRNQSAEVIRRLQAGEDFILTNNGVPVAEIRPIHGPKRSVRKEVLLAGLQGLPPADTEAWLRDIDDAVDNTIYDPYTNEPI